jgi:hypothetical protein
VDAGLQRRCHSRLDFVCGLSTDLGLRTRDCASRRTHKLINSSTHVLVAPCALRQRSCAWLCSGFGADVNKSDYAGWVRYFK